MTNKCVYKLSKHFNLLSFFINSFMHLSKINVVELELVCFCLVFHYNLICRLSMFVFDFKDFAFLLQFKNIISIFVLIISNMYFFIYLFIYYYNFIFVKTKIQ